MYIWNHTSRYLFLIISDSLLSQKNLTLVRQTWTCIQHFLIFPKLNGWSYTLLITRKIYYYDHSLTDCIHTPIYHIDSMKTDVPVFTRNFCTGWLHDTVGGDCYLESVFCMFLETRRVFYRKRREECVIFITNIRFRTVLMNQILKKLLKQIKAAVLISKHSNKMYIWRLNYGTI